MRKRCIATLLLVLCLAIGSARASSFTTYFVPAHDRLVAMRDALVAPLTKTQVKRRALIVKILRAMDAVSLSYDSDLKTARTIAVAAATSLKDDPQLPGIVLTLTTDLEADLVARIPALSTRLDALPTSAAKTKAAKSLAAVRISLAAADAAAAVPDVKAMAVALFGAATGADGLDKSIAKAEAVASGCAGIPSSGAKLTVTGGPTSPEIFKTPGMITPTVVGATTKVLYCPDGMNAQGNCNDLRILTFLLPHAPADIAVGDAQPVYITYTEGFAGWAVGTYTGAFDRGLVPAGYLRVVSTTTHSVTLCINAPLPALTPGDLPAVFTLKGYLVLAR